MSKQILFVTNFPASAWATAVAPQLAKLGDLTIEAENEVLRQIDSLMCDLVVIDASGVESELADLVNKLCCEKKKRPIIVATSAPSWRLARDVFQAGAADYIPRSLDIEPLVLACQRALAQARKEVFVEQATILLADNNSDFLDSLTQVLQLEGFTILQAHNPQVAKQILESEIVQLVLMDLRLTDDEDPQDNSGLEIAQTTMRSVPKLILTQYPTYQAAVTALKLSEKYDLPPAVDFVYKSDGLDTILTAVKNALRQFVDSQQNGSIDFVTLRELILEGFNLSELRSLCFDLSLDYEELAGQRKSDKVIELILYFQRRWLLPVLMSVCKDKRPSLPWQSIYKQD